MAKLKILTAGDPLLKEVAKPVEKIDKRLRLLLDDMAETMKDADGVGLAAPQIGKSLRLVVIDTGDGLFELINPTIIERNGTVIDSEGCLSVPGVYGEVERAASVRAEYTNRWGKRKTVEAEGLLARCIQHELDHLEGQLFIDIAKSLRREDKKKR